MRVAFTGQSGTVEQVDQDLVLEQGVNLLFDRGANPRYAGTSTPHPTYSPDAFRLVEMQSGVWSITEYATSRASAHPRKPRRSRSSAARRSRMVRAPRAQPRGARLHSLDGGSIFPAG